MVLKDLTPLCGVTPLCGDPFVWYMTPLCGTAKIGLLGANAVMQVAHALTMYHEQRVTQPTYAQAAPFTLCKPQPFCCMQPADKLLAAIACTAANSSKENICENILTEQY